MYYLYRHIRLDKNVPFYIGIGTFYKDSYPCRRYRRAYSLTGRNDYWKRIVDKTEYLVEVMYEHDDLEHIKEKEIEFIKYYGRSSDGGVLCNLTDGGEGLFNPSKEVRLKISIGNKGRKMSEKQKAAISKRFKGKKLSKEIIDKQIKYRTGKKLSEATKQKIREKALGRKIKDTSNYKKMAEDRYGLKVFCATNGKTYNCCRDACRDIFGKDTNALSNALRKGRRLYKNYCFDLV